MPVAESLCCGTPVVGFRAGGPESIAIEDHTWFAEYADVCTLGEQMLQTWLTHKECVGAACIREAALERFDKEKMGEAFVRIYDEMTEALLYE